ncbi:MAG: methyltransferase domain-containing protein [Pseudoruegeria sp.]
MKDMAAMHIPEPGRVAHSFRRGLQSYHASATVQRQVAHELIDLAVSAGLSQATSVFEFGAGTGLLTHPLIEMTKPKYYTANDLVAECGPKLSSVCASNQAVFDFLTGPVEETQPSGLLDVVASASTIQWVPELSGTLNRFCRALRPQGWLMLSGYGPEHFPELRALGLPDGAPAYRSLDQMTACLPDGMDIISQKETGVQLRFKTALDVLKHLRLTGVNGGVGKKWNRSDLQQFIEAYDDQFRTAEGDVTLTYTPRYLIARKHT